MASYLVRSRHKTCLYARVVVPAPLRSLVGRRELRRSLGTTEPHLARLRAAQFAHRAAVLFAPMMSTGKPKLPAALYLKIGRLEIDRNRRTATAEGVEIDPQNHAADVDALKSILNGIDFSELFPGSTSARPKLPSPRASRFHLLRCGRGVRQGEDHYQGLDDENNAGMGVHSAKGLPARFDLAELEKVHDHLGIIDGSFDPLKPRHGRRWRV